MDLDQLDGQVQASRAQIVDGLKEMGALEIDGAPPRTASLQCGVPLCWMTVEASACSKHRPPPRTAALIASSCRREVAAAA